MMDRSPPDLCLAGRISRCLVTEWSAMISAVNRLMVVNLFFFCSFFVASACLVRYFANAVSI